MEVVLLDHGKVINQMAGEHIISIMEIRLKVQLSMVPTMAKAFIFDGEMEVYSGAKI